ncbi:MAG: phosphate acyltransferase PlsX [Bacilli bacterium]
MIKIVVDMMGGDLGSRATVEGAIAFLKDHPDVELTAVGKIEELKLLEGVATLVDARDVLPMQAGVLDSIRAKGASMSIAIDQVLANNADAIVSSGSTGAYLGATSIRLKKIPGVLRPALISPFPTKSLGKQVVILDIGASNENSPQELVQFALMGKLYSQSVLDVQEPKVYLLSNGSEPEKGSPESKEAYLLLAGNFEGFMGNIEAREALNGSADVIVTDGFTGNIFLKSVEGLAKMMSVMIKDAFKRNALSKVGYLLSKKGFKKMSEAMNYKNYGGAMFLGLSKVAVKAHGSSDGLAFMHALRVAYRLAKAQVPSLIEKGINHHA